ncbi:PadR family transcriptional regulator [Glycomyces terrestris]|uniref:PadR family transcriptional regulator n=1 Tax=Glycomyces terrestris TaxID=2493553 RepID=A0A426UYI8_9ACTN|nr:PadR family transcriptional regulator [Glycomyces terrestris]RRR99636.1 PadR family transcriptional regulator [Glycomyces terrestris]
MLELAILGLLHESPMHGYELRKRLLALLGAIRAAFSYGSLYPTLKRMRLRGLIVEEVPAGDADAKGAGARAAGEKPLLSGRRARKVYRLTPEGKEHFAQLMADAGPESADEALFGVHFAFFSRTDPATRLRILEARRRRVEERRERIREALARTAERLDAYGLELQRHGLETAEREVRWLNELIASEEGRGPRKPQDFGDPVAGTEGPRALPEQGTPDPAASAGDPNKQGKGGMRDG